MAAEVYKTLYEWFAITPADIVAFAVCMALGLGALYAGAATWFFTVNYLDKKGDGSPTRLTTFIVAGLLGFYVFIVAGTAMLRIPHVMQTMSEDNDD